MRVVFFGSGEFGLPTLRVLHEAHDVALVVSQPDRPAGRHRQLTPTPVAQWAAGHQLPLITPARVNAPEVVEQIKAAAADVNVVVAFGQKIGDALIASPRLGRTATVNLHASLLPAYRGAAPINWAMLKGETVTGNTVFSLVDRMDAGDVLGMQSTPVDPLETAGELHDRLAEMGAPLVLDVLDQLKSGTARPQPQDELKATLAPKLSRADGVVDFTTSALHVAHRVHALTPWPGVTAWWSAAPGGQRKALLLRRVRPLTDRLHNAEPGTMLEDGLVATGDGAVQLLEVQPPGKRTMKWEEFRRGADVPIGAMFYGAVE